MRFQDIPSKYIAKKGRSQRMIKNAEQAHTSKYIAKKGRSQREKRDDRKI